MVNKPKRKGTAAESAVVSFLRDNGFPYAERLALQGGKDRGDITGVPGIVFEVKAESLYTFGSWLKEAEAERINANADYGFVVAKPRQVGSTRTGQWFAAMYSGTAARLTVNCAVSNDDLWVHHMSGLNINRDIGPALSGLPGYMTMAKVSNGMVEIAPKGVKDVDLCYVVMSLSQLCTWLVSAGYGRTS